MGHLARPVELKLARAQSQAQALIREVSGWANRKPIQAEIRPREGRLGFQIVQTGFSVQPELEQWGLAFGEYAHNLRSALDNLAYALARAVCDPPPNPRKIQYPIFLDRAQFQTKGRSCIDQLPPAAIAVIEGLQPFQRDLPNNPTPPVQDPLWLLQHLNNSDKHRVPSLVVVEPSGWEFNMAMEYETEEGAAADGEPELVLPTDPLSPGAVLMEMRTGHPIKAVHGQTTATAVVAYEGISGPAPLVETLVGLHQYVSIVVAELQACFPTTT